MTLCTIHCVEVPNDHIKGALLEIDVPTSANNYAHNPSVFHPQQQETTHFYPTTVSPDNLNTFLIRLPKDSAPLIAAMHIKI